MKAVHIRETIDKETGELLRTEKSFSTKGKEKNEEKFFMVFDGSVNNMMKNSSTDIALLFKLCSMATFNDARVEITSRKRKGLQEFLGVSRQALSNSFNKLRKSKIIFGSRDEYHINPNLFWRGTTNGRTKYLKDNVEFIKESF